MPIFIQYEAIICLQNITEVSFHKYYFEFVLEIVLILWVLYQLRKIVLENLFRHVLDELETCSDIRG